MKIREEHGMQYNFPFTLLIPPLIIMQFQCLQTNNKEQY